MAGHPHATGRRSGHDHDQRQPGASAGARAGDSPVPTSTRATDRLAIAHDASHYLLVPQAVVDAAGRRRGRRAAPGRRRARRAADLPLGRHQPVRPGRHRRRARRHPAALPQHRGARRRRAGAGAARGHGPRASTPGWPGTAASSAPIRPARSACTIGGVVANNSSGMACGTAVQQLPHAGVRSSLVLPSGTVLDTGRRRRRRAAAQRSSPSCTQGLAAAARPGARQPGLGAHDPAAVLDEEHDGLRRQLLPRPRPARSTSSPTS